MMTRRRLLWVFLFAQTAAASFLVTWLALGYSLPRPAQWIVVIALYTEATAWIGGARRRPRAVVIRKPTLDELIAQYRKPAVELRGDWGRPHS